MNPIGKTQMDEFNLCDEVEKLKELNKDPEVRLDEGDEFVIRICEIDVNERLKYFESRILLVLEGAVQVFGIGLLYARVRLSAS